MTVWTDSSRMLLFEQLAKRFGPYHTWEKGTKPGRGLNEAFDEFVAAFSAAIGCGPRGVEMQIG